MLENKIHINTIKSLTSSNDRIVFVSGNFNILHPGHLRLLKFAAECGDFLVVAILNRNSEGAILSEEERLECVSSVSYVNYAFILDTDISIFLKDLKPNYVIKGKEHENKYNSELDIVKSYGGDILFSSGEIKFSSFDILKKEFNELNHSNIIHSKEFIFRHNSISSSALSTCV